MSHTNSEYYVGLKKENQAYLDGLVGQELTDDLLIELRGKFSRYNIGLFQHNAVVTRDYALNRVRIFLKDGHIQKAQIG